MASRDGVLTPIDPERARALVPRYDRPGPRYTSYPTAPVWSDAFGAEDHARALAQSRAEALSVYVHIPFCEKLCTYCACNRVISRDHSVAAPYLDDLGREARAVAAALGDEKPCTQLAIGGGTPTYLSLAELEELCDIVDGSFPPAPGAERSIEVDPRVTSGEQLAVLAERGFNRISLGVQDLSPVVQRAINRIQSLEQTRDITDEARRLGFGSVNFDLIYGLPYQTPASFDETLDAVLAVRPDRIALYSYAHVTWVSKQQRGFERKDLPDAASKLEIFITAIRRLTEAGYLFLGMDHFALPEDELSRAARDGTLGRNFMGYTTRRADDLVGLGASGISELSDAYAQNARTPEDWSRGLGDSGLATLRGWWLDDDDRRRRWLIAELMCAGRIDPEGFADRFGERLEDRVGVLEPRLAEFARDGLLEPEGAGWRVTALGRLFLRPMAMVFDAHLEAAQPGGERAPRYSRTV
ncbi:MAG: oxygen-independent coproporphyrinogen III oxidase [Myxococcota bacterium]